MKTKRAVDVVMTFLLLFLMSYQVTEQAAHEWLGMGMTALVILHQILNRKWYAALFRGKYGAIRVLQTCVNVLLLLAFAASAVSGMALSEYAVPFFRNLIPPVTARLTHLCASYWAFLLMGAHLGLHWGVISAKLRLNEKAAFCLRIFTTAAAAYGFFLFLKQGIPVYLACGTHLRRTRSGCTICTAMSTNGAGTATETTTFPPFQIPSDRRAERAAHTGAAAGMISPRICGARTVRRVRRIWSVIIWAFGWHGTRFPCRIRSSRGMRNRRFPAAEMS